MSTHKVPESERFKGSAKYVEYLCARILVSMLQRLPIRCAYSLGRCVGWLAWKTMKRRRDTVRKNLEIVNAWMDERAGGGDLRREVAEHQTSNVEHRTSQLENKLQAPGLKFHPSAAVSDLNSQSASLGDLEAQVKEVFQRGGANLFSGFSFARTSPEQTEKYLSTAGLEQLKAALAAGKGAIILLAHMGPWEALSQLPGLAQKHGIEASFGAMYRPLNNHYLDEWFKAEREGQGTRLFSRRDGFHKPVDFLRSGGMLGILSDQKMREGPKVPYFGVVAPTSPVAGLFQRRSGAAVLAVSVETLGRAKWKISVHPVEWPEVLAPKDRETPARVCNAAVEQAVARSPLDAFWLHKRF